MSFEQALDSLTETQRQAATHIEGPALILAGPGSGKTRVITHRIANLLHHGVAGENILALTFTNKAASEMRQRVQTLAPDTGVHLSTFHSFCARLLRFYGRFVGLEDNYTILDASDSRSLLKSIVSETELLTMTSLESIADGISGVKNKLMRPDEFEPKPGSPIGSIVAEIYPLYQKRLLETNSVDFDDLLMHIGTILRDNEELRSQLDHRFEYIMVDEYQDTNLAQYSIVRALSIERPNLAVTGDPDQSVYGWRGANINNILDFERDYPNVQVIRLEQNFRSTPNILNVADELISHNKRRKPKSLFTDHPPGKPVRLVAYDDWRKEAEGIASQIAHQIHAGRKPSDFAVMYRVNHLSRSFEHAFRALGIPYHLVQAQEFYQRREVKDVIAYLHLINNPRNDVAFLRAINMPPRGIGKKTLQRLRDFARTKHISLLEAAQRADQVESLNARAISSLSKFVTMFESLQRGIGAPLETIVTSVLQESELLKYFEQQENEDGDARAANLNELIAAAHEFDEMNPDTNNLELFLEQASLTSDIDGWESDGGRVTLMSLHMAKGLEFPVVFLVAFEAGIIPHSRVDLNDVEEERRLLFVGITRAMEELQISLAKRRMERGRDRHTVISSFSMEIPRGEIEMHGLTTIEDSNYRSDPYSQVADDDGPQWDQSLDQWDGVDEGGEGYGDAEQEKPLLNPNLLMTASQLMNQYDEEEDEFAEGTLVEHPENGTGVIIRSQGRGKRRTVTILFDESGIEQAYVLEHVSLKPII